MSALKKEIQPRYTVTKPPVGHICWLKCDQCSEILRIPEWIMRRDTIQCWHCNTHYTVINPEPKTETATAPRGNEDC